MSGYIYKTVDTVNNKIYIGKRTGEFNPSYFGSGVYLKKAINKLGRDKFKLEVIVYTEDKDKLDELERKYILEYREMFGKDNLYNIADGGDGHPQSEETRKKISANNIGMTGKNHSQEAKEKMRLAKLGKKHTKEHIEKVRLALKGKKKSPEHIEKVRIARWGK